MPPPLLASQTWKTPLSVLRPRQAPFTFCWGVMQPPGSAAGGEVEFSPYWSPQDLASHVAPRTRSPRLLPSDHQIFTQCRLNTASAAGCTHSVSKQHVAAGKSSLPPPIFLFNFHLLSSRPELFPVPARGPSPRRFLNSHSSFAPLESPLTLWSCSHWTLFLGRDVRGNAGPSGSLDNSPPLFFSTLFTQSVSSVLC